MFLLLLPRSYLARRTADSARRAISSERTAEALAGQVRSLAAENAALAERGAAERRVVVDRVREPVPPNTPNDIKIPISSHPVAIFA